MRGVFYPFESQVLTAEYAEESCISQENLIIKKCGFEFERLTDGPQVGRLMDGRAQAGDSSLPEPTVRLTYAVLPACAPPRPRCTRAGVLYS